MTQPRPPKRPRTTEGTVYHDAIPLAGDDYSIVYAHKARTVKVNNTRRPVPAERSPQYQTDSWSRRDQWAPSDDQTFALDPDDGAWYDEAVEGDVMDDSSPPTSKKKRTKVSKRPHIVWMDLHRDTYLDEVLRWAGRGDFRGQDCPDCIGRKVVPAGRAEHRCIKCFHPDLLCASCCVARHKHNPFHRIEKWAGSQFVEVSLKSMGLRIQLNHTGMYCTNPIACHSAMLVLHTNGFHKVAIDYCGCTRTRPQHIQLLRRRLYPASQITVKTCTTFDYLRLLHTYALTTKASTYDFYRAMERLTSGTGIDQPKSRYRALFRIVLQWRHLQMLKWGGRGHDVEGVKGTKPGELAILCPSCPRPGINLQPGWEAAPPGMKFLYMVIICMDANFRLKNNLVSNYSQDPGLGTGWSYMIPRGRYEKYVLNRANDEDISSCVSFQALVKANTKNTAGLRYTGTGAVVCGRSEMILPLAVGNLHKGERYSNMDYIFGSAVQSLSVPLILISYDICCQWFVNLFKRMENHWPDEIKIDSSKTLTPAIPKLHYSMHKEAGHQVYSLNYIRGVGQSDCETPERVWAPHNALGNSTKTQGPGSRQDVLDDHFSFWNWQKVMGLGLTLVRRYKSAVADRNIQTEGHRGLTEALDGPLVAKWERMCVDWERDAFPKTKKNPYETDGTTLSEAQVKKEFAEEEEQRLSSGGVVLNATSAAGFLALGLELEEVQRRLRRLAKSSTDNTTVRKEGNLTEQRNLLRTRLRACEQLAHVYMPGLLQYQIDLQSPRPQPAAASGQSSEPSVLPAAASAPTPSTRESMTQPPTSGPAQLPSGPTESNQPEHSDIWLPSRIPTNRRNAVCRGGLAEMEDKLRDAQCRDALESVRHILKIKARMILFKNRNVRGQRSGTRSRAVIDRVHERARIAAEKYRAARQAKFCLVGPGDWENTLRVLHDSDVRGYQDPNRLRVRRPRRGVLEDDQVEDEEQEGSTVAMEVDPNNMGEDITLLNKARTRRDGTGETRRTLSWIWQTVSLGADAEQDDILRSEWAKSRARAARTCEEVLLLKEEMQRVLLFLAWKASWWEERVSARSGLSKDMAEALAAFAHSQAGTQRSLATHFEQLWKIPLGPDADMQELAAEDPDADDDDDDEESDDDDDGIEGSRDTGSQEVDEANS